MRSDKQLYQLLAAVPEWFTPLTGIPLRGTYRFEAMSLKALEKAVDGVLLPETAGEPVYLIEFQAYDDAQIYHRSLWSLHYWHLHREEPAQAVLWFSDVSFDPKTAPWHELGRQDNPAFHVVYLAEILAKLPENHPLCALFLPFYEEKAEVLEQKLPAAYETLKEYQQTLPASKQAILLEVFFSWLLQRFKTMNRQEILAMIKAPTVPIEETRFYQEIFAEGIEKAKRELAQSMIADGLPLEKVAAYTKLPIETLQKLQSNGDA